MARRRLSKSDVKRLNERLARFNIVLSKKDAVDVVEEGGETFYYVNEKPYFFVRNDSFVPHVKLLLRQPRLLPRVVVDMGAVKFVTNGADVMRPGVTAVDEGVVKGGPVVVVEERHGKALAVGESLFDREALLAAKEGKVVLLWHHVGDKAWEKAV